MKSGRATKTATDDAREARIPASAALFDPSINYEEHPIGLGLLRVDESTFFLDPDVLEMNELTPTRTDLRLNMLEALAPLKVSLGGEGVMHGGSATETSCKVASAAVARYAAAKIEQIVLDSLNAEPARIIRPSRLTRVYFDLLKRLDPDTACHSARVAIYMTVFGKELGIPPEDLKNVRSAGLLHDIGKLCVPDSVLRSTERLDPEGMAFIKPHSEFGNEILRRGHDILFEASGIFKVNLPHLFWSELVALQHHERIDGGGYPRGLRGSEIHFLSKLCAVCDIWDALTSTRTYKPALPKEEAIQLLIQNAGSTLDKDLVERFIFLVETNPDLCELIGSLQSPNARGRIEKEVYAASGVRFR